VFAPAFSRRVFDVPVPDDIDLVPPQMALVNGALATVTLAGATGKLVQSSEHRTDKAQRTSRWPLSAS
jgi:hypothetical protein